MLRHSGLTIVAALGSVCLPATSYAQDAQPTSSSFALIAPAEADGATRTSKSRQLFTFTVRPTQSVVLSETIAPALAESFGAHKTTPFTAGIVLHGFPEQPGLYCDLLRNRGLGLTAACLRDTNSDGKFDEGVRFDFNSARSDILLISHSSKIIGAKFKLSMPLPKPVAYAVLEKPADVSGKLALSWKSDFKPKKRDDPRTITGTLSIATPENMTGTLGLSQQMVEFRLGDKPLNLDYYGLAITLHKVQPDGSLSYSVRSAAEGTPIPLLFKGYVTFIRFY